MRWFLRHPRGSIATLGTVFIILGGTGFGVVYFRNLRRMEVLHERLSELGAIRSLRQQLEISLLDEVRDALPSGSFLVEDVRLQVENALALAGDLDRQSALGLRRIEALLSRPGAVNRVTLINALETAGEVYERETGIQEELLRQVREDGRREFLMGILLLLSMALLATAATWLVPKRLLDPLSHLRAHFRVLESGHFLEVSMEEVDPPLVPLFRNYNSLVRRLADLEEERRRRAESLENEVRAGSRALLEQQRALANAERLAVVGETAAGLAHDLRNPLAGVLAALENMERETEDPTVAERLDLLRRETQRVIRRLNDYLAVSRHAPEPPASTDVQELVAELLSLLRYQAPPSVHLKRSVEQGLRCSLPAGRIRQALLNLVGNSLQALDARAGTVEVLAFREGKKLHLEVKDDGPGFSEEMLRTAGQPFRTGRSSGTGLGLATVQRTVTDLGGTMTVRNLNPEGACVTLSLPFWEGGRSPPPVGCEGAGADLP